jgi:hypothetical protein
MNQMTVSAPNPISLFSLFWKIKGGLLDHLAVCLFFCLCIPSSFSLAGLCDHLTVCLCIPPNFFVFYAVRDISKESGRLVLPRTSLHIHTGPPFKFFHYHLYAFPFPLCVTHVVAIKPTLIWPLNLVNSIDYDFFFLFGLWDYRHCGHSWPIVPASGDNEDDYGEHDGM